MLDSVPKLRSDLVLNITLVNVPYLD